MFNKTCPKCNYKFTFKTIFIKRYSQKIICPNCKAELTASIKSKFIFSIITLLTFLLWFAISEFTKSTLSSYSKYGLAFVLFFLLFFIIEPLIHKYELAIQPQQNTAKNKNRVNTKPKIKN